MRNLLIALALALTALVAQAKEAQFVVRAFVREAAEAKWTPVPNVHVSLSHADDGSLVDFKLLSGNDSTKVVNNDSGEIRLLVNGGRGSYLLTLDTDGYEPLMKDFELKYKSQSVISLPQLSMVKERSLALNEVEVIGTAVKLVVKGDTLVYNANALNLAEGSMLDAIIKQLDGVELDTDGNITVNGRSVSSLLINGKDFFKGDPLVALENLPAYTVNNVKVYDKAAEDDYLTQSSSKLARREDEENLVMDVVLKKEYNFGYMGSVEGGYGTDNRWLGKLFGLGFSEKWRLSAFYNTNNLGDTQRAGANGWRNNSQSTGDLFHQSSSKLNNLSNNLRTSHELKQKWDAVYFGADLNFTYNQTKASSLQREATFNAQPEEASRIEALDSVFARPFSLRYNDLLLSRVSTNQLTNKGSISAGGELEATIRTGSMLGRVNLEIGGSYDRSWTDGSVIYRQNFGGANSGGAAPVNSDRYDPEHTHSYDIKANATYTRDWSIISGEKWQNRINLRTRLAYTRSEVSEDYDLYTAEGRDDVLPSLQIPEYALQDLADSYNSTQVRNNGVARVQVNFNRELLAPTATGVNPAFGFSAAVTYQLRNERLNYHVAQLKDPEILTRTTNHVATQLNANFSSGNDLRYWTVQASYSNSSADPSLNLFLRTRTNINPLFIYENNASDLRASMTNQVSLRFNRFGRKIHNTLFGNFSWSQTDNTVGQWSSYDPNTGITTSRPMNINGNWSTNGNINYSHPLGAREQVLLSGNVNASYNHSIDFQSTTSEPVRSLVRNTNLGASTTPPPKAAKWPRATAPPAATAPIAPPVLATDFR
ncbi:MAG: outer membrane beta-barrel family protein [Bacteroides sp.]|nr:outer membrane beta-barrel family protein [Bacteroides sp.]MCM1378602.1 outer membrane beta-barrel family protein [Bacteroides sp.]MCM1444903.1 outer membrane beta-barrel family protein [Prevotella sp.]